MLQRRDLGHTTTRHPRSGALPSLDGVLASLASRTPALAPPLVALAREAGRVRVVAAGARVFAAGEPVRALHLVAAGMVRVMRDAGERGVVVHRETAGGLLGEVALFSDGRYPATALALEPTTLVELPASAVHGALATDPELALLLLHRLASRTREVIGRLDRIATLTVVRRLAVHLAERAGRARSDVVTLGMTQQQLADELGTVRELVARELGTLVRLGLLEAVGGGKYRVLDAEGLRRMGGIEVAGRDAR